MAIELAQGLSRFFRRDYKPALEDPHPNLLPEYTIDIAQSPTASIESMAQEKPFEPEVVNKAEVENESALTQQVKEILDKMLSETSINDEIPQELLVNEEQKIEVNQQAQEQVRKKIEGWNLVQVAMQDAKSSELAQADFDGKADIFQQERKQFREPSAEDVQQILRVTELLTKKGLSTEEIELLERSAVDSSEKLSKLIQTKLNNQKEIENQNKEIGELRGALPNESLSKEKQLSEKVEKAQELQFSKGSEVVSLLKEKQSEIDANVLQQATELMKEAIRAEKDSWRNLAQIRDRMIQRFPAQQNAVLEAYEAMVQEMKSRKDGIEVPSRIPEFSEDDKNSKYAWSRFSLENIANKSLTKDATVLGSLYAKLGVDADGVFTKGSILQDAIGAEKQLQMISERMEPSMRKAEADPQIAEKLLMLMQARYQAEARLRDLEPKIDEMIRAESTEMTKNTDTSTTSENLSTIEEEEEEESLLPTSTPSSIGIPQSEGLSQSNSTQTEQINPAIAEAQEELKRLEQRRIELQELLSRSLPPTQQG